MPMLDPRDYLAAMKAEKASLPWRPLAPSEAIHHWAQTPMVEEADLAYLHAHWRLPDAPPPETRRGMRGRVVRRMGRLMFHLLGPYFQQERELLAHMVRLNNSLARRCDELTNELTSRQRAEASNQAELAAWLDVHCRSSFDHPPGDD